VVFAFSSVAAFADGEGTSSPTLESVTAAIGELSNDPRDFKAEDREKVEAIQTD